MDREDLLFYLLIAFAVGGFLGLGWGLYFATVY